MLSEDCVRDVLESLAMHYPARKLSPLEIETLLPDWLEDCRDLTEVRFREAVGEHRRASPYFPTVADVRDARRRLDEEALKVRRAREGAAAPGKPFSGLDRSPGATPWEVREAVRGMLRTVGDPAAGNDEALDGVVRDFFPNLGCLSGPQLRAAVGTALEQCGASRLPAEIDVLRAHGLVHGQDGRRADFGRVMAMYCKHTVARLMRNAAAGGNADRAEGRAEDEHEETTAETA